MARSSRCGGVSENLAFTVIQLDRVFSALEDDAHSHCESDGLLRHAELHLIALELTHTLTNSHTHTHTDAQKSCYHRTILLLHSTTHTSPLSPQFVFSTSACFLSFVDGRWWWWFTSNNRPAYASSAEHWLQDPAHPNMSDIQRPSFDGESLCARVPPWWGLCSAMGACCSHGVTRSGGSVLHTNQESHEH